MTDTLDLPADVDLGEHSERNRYMIELHVVHRKTLTDIGKIIGVSRERVRQIVRRAGIPEDLTEEIRRKQSMNRVTHVCEWCGREKELRACDAENRRFCSTDCYHDSLRDQLSDEALLDALRDLAGTLGRTPTKEDVCEHTPHSHTVYYDRFGSFRKAQRLAGLKPNKLGGSRR